MNKSYTIPSARMSIAHELIAKLNRKTNKLGLPVLTIVVTDISKIDDPNFKKHEWDKIYQIEVPQIEMTTFDLNVDIIKLAGWTFLGTLDHHSVPGQVLVHTVPGQVVPSNYFNSPPVCDHCTKKRRRVETFVVRHENGDEKQVGRQCIADFLGTDPNRIISQLEGFRKLEIALREEEESGNYGSREEMLYNLDKILLYTISVIRKDGWVSRKIAQDRSDVTATSTTVQYLLSYPPSDSRAAAEWKKTQEHYAIDPIKVVPEIAAMRDWILMQPDTSEYMHNLHIIVKANDVPYKLIGYACSIVSSYQRAMETLRTQAIQRKTNEWFGDVGQKMEIEVKVMAIKPVASLYGVTTIFRMLDTEGRTAIWFASGEVDTMSEGRKYMIRGTVKKHDEFKDWKQTMLTRVKVLKTIDDEVKQ